MEVLADAVTDHLPIYRPRTRCVYWLLRRLVWLEMTADCEVPAGRVRVVMDVDLDRATMARDSATSDDLTYAERLTNLANRIKLVLSVCDQDGDDLVLVRGGQR